MNSIDFIIISYNRPADTLELLENIIALDHASTMINQLILVNNASTEDYTGVKNFAATTTTIPIRYIDSSENLGVTGGRNLALQYAQADILVFLDDDCVLQHSNTLTLIQNSFATIGPDNRETAIVSFKVLYYSTMEMQINGLPHKKIRNYKDREQFYTYYFAGGAHAVKRKVVEATGPLPVEFFYGMEEYDLSYRILDQGYCIKYDASIVMLHKESPQGRKPKEVKLRMMWVNKCKVAWRYLPKVFFYSTAVMWSLQYLKETGFQMSHFFWGWKDVCKIPSTEKRRPVSKSTLSYLKGVEARLWY